jgi:hypothetical protein
MKKLIIILKKTVIEFVDACRKICFSCLLKIEYNKSITGLFISFCLDTRERKSQDEQEYF